MQKIRKKIGQKGQIQKYVKSNNDRKIRKFFRSFSFQEHFRLFIIDLEIGTIEIIDKT